MPIPLKSAIHGCWMGKSIGGTLGLAAEGRIERLHFTFYSPVPTSAPPNDDLELQLVWLDLVEKAGTTLTQADFARAWLDHIHYMWDEYGRCRWNLRRGVPVENVGTFENYFESGMGSPIRSEFWACLFPGDPDSAAHYAALDATLDHGVEGIAGEVFFAVMEAAVLGGAGVGDAITQALTYLPADCETTTAIGFVLQEEQRGTSEWDCWQELLLRHGNENFTHAPLNVALTVWALRYGKQDFEKSILLAVNGGYDTDCTAATVGATLGMILGTDGIPTRWIEPIGEGIYIGSGIVGINAAATLTELTERTMALIGKLERRAWDMAYWNLSLPKAVVDTLQGYIHISPLDGSEAIPWSNGELPAEVLAAGGASWEWEFASDESREVICLAHDGARLFVDDRLVIECPPGLPFVPATHRCPAKAHTTVCPGKGMHVVRLELARRGRDQMATVLLAYPNLHIAPWTTAELPNAAIL